MIADVLSNYHLYSSVHKDWDRAFEIIRDMLGKPIPAGANVRADVDNIKIVMQTYKTVKAEEKKYEGHKKCIDIQFMVKGKEIVYWANNADMTVCVPYSEERDHMSFDNTEVTSPIHLTEKTFAVFFPADAHKTQCIWDNECDCVKIIVKLPL